jgi:hypothetical protein
LVSVSNVVVSGKGRRYRRDWKNRPFQAVDVAHLFGERVRGAISDIHRFAARPAVRVEVLHGDARRVRPKGLYDVAVLSPPYPNSFDYTDVYNVELWVLGYLNDSDENKALRNSTLASHVQLQRAYAAAPGESETLKQTLERLHGIRDNLWSPWIPQMIGGYFADLVTVLRILHDAVAESGACWLVVGDSRYGGIRVPTATVLSELACSCGWAVQAIEPFRSMRSSAQQGGRSELAESLLIFNRALPRA